MLGDVLDDGKAPANAAVGIAQWHIAPFTVQAAAILGDVVVDGVAGKISAGDNFLPDLADQRLCVGGDNQLVGMASNGFRGGPAEHSFGGGVPLGYTKILVPRNESQRQPAHVKFCPFVGQPEFFVDLLAVSEVKHDALTADNLAVAVKHRCLENVEKTNLAIGGDVFLIDLDGLSGFHDGVMMVNADH